MQRIVPLAVLSVLLTGCNETPHPTSPEEIGTPLFSSAPVRAPITATPIAACAADIGFNIGFVIKAEQLTHTTQDARGKTHSTRHFQAKGFEGWKLTQMQSSQAGFAARRASSSPDYIVQGGAEMFNTQRDAQGHITIMIHQGNLVFVDRATGQRVIAHHTIRQVPGQETQNFWSCRLVG